MPEANRPCGIFSPVLTPFDSGLAPDAQRLVRHCRWLLAQDVGLAVFGTNSEANSLSVSEKRRLLDALLEAGVPPARLLPGTGACALPDAIELTRHAVRTGCAGALMLPPFYYKGVSDEGLFRSFARVIDAVADERLRVFLYHIPAVSGVPLSLSLIERLLQAYPGIVAGIKDSSGDWSNTAAMLERFQPRGFDVFAGSENFLLATMRAGGAGCITATGNVNPGPIVRLFETWKGADAEAQQELLDRQRAAFAAFPMIPAMKAAIAWKSGRTDWRHVRPPLVELDPAQQLQLQAALDRVGFSMPEAESLA
ncbi:MAG TPA: dihydrodipicolinate synthase family protein [Ramlibacter sp.]|nr:dihydrodipicolinate synthase family protein [Ramlibacter sp.]